MQEDLDFMAETEAALLQQNPTGGRLILWGIALFLVAGLAWAAWAQIDEVTRGAGRIIPSRQLQVVQNLEGGIVSQILVHEGEVVNKGQVLLRLEPTSSNASYRENYLHYLAHKVKAARLRAEADGKAFVPPADVMREQPKLADEELRLYESRQKELASTLGILQHQAEQRTQEVAELKAKREQLGRSYQLVARELRMTRPLVKEGAVSPVEVLRLERQANDLKGELEAATLGIPAAQSKLEEARRKIEEERLKFRNTARAELTETLAELSRLSESNVALKDRLQRTEVRSPMHGVVKRMMVNTVGGVIKPGMDLVEIVPLEDTLVVEARIRPADIGFIHPGQHALIKFSAYDYAIYGGLDATVKRIGADTVTDDKGNAYYEVRLRTEHNHLGNEAKPLPIIPGMTATVDILTGKKSVLAYLMKPVLRAKEYALRER